MPRMEPKSPATSGGGLWIDLTTVAADEAFPTGNAGTATGGKHVLNFGVDITAGTTSYDLDVCMRTRPTGAAPARWLCIATYTGQTRPIGDELECGDYDRFKLRIYTLAGAGPHAAVPTYFLR
jgi:hypothetical protein